MTKLGEKGVDFVAEKTHIPTWGVVAIFVLILLIILGICGFCIRRFFKKRRSKDGKKGMKGVDMKSVQLLGSAYKEKVNIIMSIACLAVYVIIKTNEIIETLSIYNEDELTTNLNSNKLYILSTNIPLKIMTLTDTNYS